MWERMARPILLLGPDSESCMPLIGSISSPTRASADRSMGMSLRQGANCECETIKTLFLRLTQPQQAHNLALPACLQGQ